MALTQAGDRAEMAWRRDGRLKNWQLTNSRRDACTVRADANAVAAVVTSWCAP
jgi:hypothetical protein